MARAPSRPRAVAARSAARLTVDRAAPRAALDFAGEVARGLAATPKRIPCRFFYDAVGSALFDAICRQPEYYLTRAEDEILAARADESVAACAPACTLVELGSGSALKTQRVIEAFLRRAPALVYRPIDIAEEALLASSRALLDRYPGLSIEAVAAEYADGLERLGRLAEPALVLWLGSNIGNFDRDEAARFLGRLARGLSAFDRVLVGIDLRKAKAVLEPAYDDARGITARFNLHLLERINAELGGRFDLARFRHVAPYDEALGRIDMYVESARDQVVEIAALGRSVAFGAGERVHTESSYKYSPAEIEALARAAGLAIERTWTDRRRRFALVLCAPREPAR